MAAEQEGYTEEDVASTLKLLTLLASDESLFLSTEMRQIRKALQPLVTIQTRGMFDGAPSKDQYTHRKDKRKERKFLINQQKVEDQKFVSKTLLRAGRIKRLEALAEQGLGDIQLVLDGVGMEPDVSEAQLLENKESADEQQHQQEEQQEEEEEIGDKPQLQQPRQCYTCKRRYTVLHTFYDKLCEQCSALNFEKRHQTCDMTGRIALVTGARVKIGFQTTLKLLRAGATVLATSRFPRDCASRYTLEPDFAEFKGRLRIYGIDFRDLLSVEAFCTHVEESCGRLDVIINNACQTISRPAQYYQHLQALETLDFGELAPEIKALLPSEGAGLRISSARRSGTGQQNSIHPLGDGTTSTSDSGSSTTTTSSTSTTSTSSSSLEVSTEIDAAELFPSHLYDVNNQQLDLRTNNSWLLRMHQVHTPELAEVFAINTLAPYIIAARLKGLMDATVEAARRVLASTETATPSPLMSASSSALSVSLADAVLETSAFRVKGADHSYTGSGPNGDSGNGGAASDAATKRCHHTAVAFIVNVSSMEGKFYRRKLPTHPHTNMAKAALNMMTRTSACDYIQSNIAMTSVDTGWINDENPLEKAAKAAARHSFATPLDEVDAAARILDPVFAPLRIGQADREGLCAPPWGCFLKDYYVSEW